MVYAIQDELLAERKKKRKRKNQPVSVRQTEVEKILPQLSTQLARLLFPCSLSPVTSTETAAKYICGRRRRSRGLAEELVYLSDVCGSF